MRQKGHGDELCGAMSGFQRAAGRDAVAWRGSQERLWPWHWTRVYPGGPASVRSFIEASPWPRNHSEISEQRLHLLAGEILVGPVDNLIRRRIHWDGAGRTNVQTESTLLRYLGLRPSSICRLAGA